MAVAVSGAFRLSFGLKPTGSEVGYELRIANSRASREPVRGDMRTAWPGARRRVFYCFAPFSKKGERTFRQERNGPAGPDAKIFDN